MYQFLEFFFHGTFPKIYKHLACLREKKRKKKVIEEGKERKENATGSDFLCEVLRRTENSWSVRTAEGISKYE